MNSSITDLVISSFLGQEVGRQFYPPENPILTIVGVIFLGVLSFFIISFFLFDPFYSPYDYPPPPFFGPMGPPPGPGPFYFRREGTAGGGRGVGQGEDPMLLVTAGVHQAIEQHF